MADSMRRNCCTGCRLLGGVTLALAVVGVSLGTGGRDLRAQPPGTPLGSADKAPEAPRPKSEGIRLPDAPRVATTPQAVPPPPSGGPGPGGPPPVLMGSATSRPGLGMAVGSSSPRFDFKIDPKTPLKDLLPVPPKVRKPAGPVLTDDLTRVPEVEFQAAAKGLSAELATRDTAHLIAKINHLNGKKADGFVEALRESRRDLAGLPFAMGDACRTKGERSREFAAAVNAVRTAIQVAENGRSHRSRGTAEAFWEKYQAECDQADKHLLGVDRAQRKHVIRARIAALMQVLMPETADMRLGLVKHLAAVSDAEATRALARLAVFSAEDEVRKAAVEALQVRRERDYTDVLLRGLRYPWPAVARRAADALVKLERTDLIPQVVDVLDEADPRAPVVREVDGKRVPVVRELVRVNHHKSCLLCHAPGNTGKVSPESLTAGVPVPGQPMAPPSGGYQNSVPELLVRVDVTYLRQDFSLLQAVADANPWPEMQRFDFLVRSRVLSDDEAAAYREKLGKREPGKLSPYHRAALAALRELTGRDTEPTPQAWRRLLDLPAKSRRTAAK